MADPQVKVVIAAQDNATGPLDRVGQSFRTLQDHGRSFTTGMRTVNTTLISLASEAVGVDSKLGRLAGTFLSFAVGGGIVGVVAGGIALVVKWIQDLKTESGAAAKAVTDLATTTVAAWHRTQEGTIQGLQGQLEQLRARHAALLEAERLRAAGPATTFRPGRFGPIPVEGRAGAPTTAFTQELAANATAQQIILQQIAKMQEAAGRDAQRELDRVLAAQHAQRVEAAGGGNRILPPGAGVPGTPGFLLGATAEERSMAAFLGPSEGVRRAGAAIDGLGKSLDLAADSAKRFQKQTSDLHISLVDLRDAAIRGLTEGFVELFSVLGKGPPNPDRLAKLALKAVAAEAAGKGKLAIGEGLVKIAKAIWPPNPPELLSGTLMVAKGGALVALAGQVAGGGAAGGAAGSGGSLGAGGFGQAQQASAESRGSVTIQVPRNMMVLADDPRWLDLWAETLAQAQGRRIIFQVT